jgi:hypothetical protein
MLKLDMTAVDLETLFNLELDKTVSTTPLAPICEKCNGSGNFIGYTGRVVGPCFACKGKGVKEVKSPVAANKVDVSKILVAFNTAFSNGIKRPKLRLGDFVFSRAPDTGRNAGSVYVKKGETYLGKVTGGEFFPVRDCDDTTTKGVIEVASKPGESAKAFGFRTGNCSCCGRTLTNGESIDLGIGPICAEKFGF